MPKQAAPMALQTVVKVMSIAEATFVMHAHWAILAKAVPTAQVVSAKIAYVRQARAVTASCLPVRPISTAAEIAQAAPEG